MLAAGGALDQDRRPHERAWGDVADPAVLRGWTRWPGRQAATGCAAPPYGRIGGRPMADTAVANTTPGWTKFGVDVEGDRPV